MCQRSFKTHLIPVCMALLAVVFLAKPVYSQNNRIDGSVIDSNGNPISGASITVASTSGAGTYELTTDDDGKFFQSALRSGDYTVTVQAEGFGFQGVEVNVAGGNVDSVTIQLLSPQEQQRSTLSEEELASLGAFDAGVAAVNSGDNSSAIASFSEALAADPDCFECYQNLGVVYTDMEEYEQAEAAFQQIIDLNPEPPPLDSGRADPRPAAYAGLASLYNAQQRFDEAAEASAASANLSGGLGGGAESTFNQGLFLWNGGRLDEARVSFEETIRLDPEYGEAHYWLGMSSLNGGNLTEAAASFALYLEYDPNGRFAAQAQGMLTQLPQP